MSDQHNIITALMTNQSSTAVEMIKSTLEKRAEQAIKQFVNAFDYKEQEPTANVEAE